MTMEAAAHCDDFNWAKEVSVETGHSGSGAHRLLQITGSSRCETACPVQPWWPLGKALPAPPAALAATAAICAGASTQHPCRECSTGIDAAEICWSWRPEGRALCSAVRAGQAINRHKAFPTKSSATLYLHNASSHTPQSHEAKEPPGYTGTSSCVSLVHGRNLPSDCVHRRAQLSCLVHLNAASVSDTRRLPATSHLGMPIMLAGAVMFTGAALNCDSHRCFMRSVPGLIWGTTRKPPATAAVNRLPCSSSGTRVRSRLRPSASPFRCCRQGHFSVPTAAHLPDALVHALCSISGQHMHTPWAMVPQPSCSTREGRSKCNSVLCHGMMGTHLCGCSGERYAVLGQPGHQLFRLPRTQQSSVYGLENCWCNTVTQVTLFSTGLGGADGPLCVLIA